MMKILQLLIIIIIIIITTIIFNNNNNNNKAGNVTVLWNQAVHTDREVTTNRSDKIIKNKNEKTCTLIDVAIPADRNFVQKEAEKKLKYKSMCIEIQRMWNLKCTIVPVIIGATGIVTRSRRGKIWKLYRENTRQIHYKRQLYLEHHT